MAGELGDPDLKLAGAAHGFECLLAPAALPPPGEHYGGNEQDQRQRSTADEDFNGSDIPSGEAERNLVKLHGGSLS